MAQILSWDTEDGVIHIPLPSRWHHMARVAYKVLLAVLGVIAFVALPHTNDPAVVMGASLIMMMLPTLLFVERRIRQTDWKESAHRRAGLFFTEHLIPLSSVATLPAIPVALQVCANFRPSMTALAFIDTIYVLVVGLGGILSNQVWVMNQLGYGKLGTHEPVRLSVGPRKRA